MTVLVQPFQFNFNRQRCTHHDVVAFGGALHLHVRPCRVDLLTKAALIKRRDSIRKRFLPLLLGRIHRSFLYSRVCLCFVPRLELRHQRVVLSVRRRGRRCRRRTCALLLERKLLRREASFERTLALLKQLLVGFPLVPVKK